MHMYTQAILYQLVDCDNSPRINIVKSNHFYYLSIPMCSNDQCAADVHEIVDGIEWINCNNNVVCEDCRLSPWDKVSRILTHMFDDTLFHILIDCGGNNAVCEQKLEIASNL